MKNILIHFLLVMSLAMNAQQVNFDDYFINKTLRFDYINAGNSDTNIIYLKQLKQEPYWGGSHTNLIDIFNYGQYKVVVIDKQSGKEIYSRAYNTLFSEWQDIPEAKTVPKGFYESAVMPFPKDSATILIQKIDKKNIYHTIYKYEFDPNSIFIKKDLVYDFQTGDILNNGPVDKKVDIVILAEGYTKDEMGKFIADAKKMTNFLFEYEPFKSHKDDFNVHYVESYSEESGTDNPGKGIWKRTIMNSSFWTFGTERYLTTEDFKSVRDVAALAPYDQIYVLVNTDKYGGGGIYNFFNLCVSDHPAAPQVFVHEFGHGFGGLADEYDYGDESNADRYDLSVEPIEPNITTLVHFDQKWQDMVTPGTKIPTEVSEENKGKIGAFEGAGYVAKGVYRPTMGCIMRELKYKFCPVCQRALTEMIDFYSE